MEKRKGKANSNEFLHTHRSLKSSYENDFMRISLQTFKNNQKETFNVPNILSQKRKVMVKTLRSKISSARESTPPKDEFPFILDSPNKDKNTVLENAFLSRNEKHERFSIRRPTIVYTNRERLSWDIADPNEYLNRIRSSRNSLKSNEEEKGTSRIGPDDYRPIMKNFNDFKTKTVETIQTLPSTFRLDLRRISYVPNIVKKNSIAASSLKEKTLDSRKFSVNSQKENSNNFPNINLFKEKKSFRFTNKFRESLKQQSVFGRSSDSKNDQNLSKDSIEENTLVPVNEKFRNIRRKSRYKNMYKANKMSNPYHVEMFRNSIFDTDILLTPIENFPKFPQKAKNEPIAVNIPIERVHLKKEITYSNVMINFENMIPRKCNLRDASLFSKPLIYENEVGMFGRGYWMECIDLLLEESSVFNIEPGYSRILRQKTSIKNFPKINHWATEVEMYKRFMFFFSQLVVDLAYDHSTV